MKQKPAEGRVPTTRRRGTAWAVVLLVSVILVSIPALAHHQFRDVAEGHLRRADIQFVADAERGWFGGYPDGTFQPERTITPKQMTAVLERVFPDGTTRAEFAAFVRGGHWYIQGGRWVIPVDPSPPPSLPQAKFGSCEELIRYITENASETVDADLALRDQSGPSTFRRYLSVIDPGNNRRFFPEGGPGDDLLVCPSRWLSPNGVEWVVTAYWSVDERGFHDIHTWYSKPKDSGSDGN